uniref:Nuclear receptor subfamily 1, group D, member 2a n=1 Tax=Eptatretus burgeri TaxID=7764 RepID=A0A8C4N277_EPTBU
YCKCTCCWCSGGVISYAAIATSELSSICYHSDSGESGFGSDTSSPMSTIPPGSPALRPFSPSSLSSSPSASSAPSPPHDPPLQEHLYCPRTLAGPLPTQSGSVTINGIVLLCKVCGDTASGFHYGVHACEGCKGFFRRSIQQNIKYKPCLKNEDCPVVRANRNRCQHCRFKKCLSVGMSKDAVRFGRIPKREKLRLLEEVRSTMSAASSGQLGTISHAQPCNMDWNGTREVGLAQDEVSLVFNQSGGRPVNKIGTPADDGLLGSTSMQAKRAYRQHNPGAAAVAVVVGLSRKEGLRSDLWEEFSSYFTPAVKQVVAFARSIPGFLSLSQFDQVALLKAGTFEVLAVRFSSLFDPESRTVRFHNGRSYSLPELQNLGMGNLLHAMFEFTEKLASLQLSPDEMDLFSSVVLVSADRFSIKDTAAVERLQDSLIRALRDAIELRHSDGGMLLTKLLLRLPELRTLNNMHSERLLAFRISD